MSNPIRGSLTQWVACLLLLSAGQAMAGDEPRPSAASAADADRHAKPYFGHKLSNAEKAALVKQRMKSCRLHPGSCEQGAKDQKHKSKPTEQAQAPEKADQ